MRGGKVVRREKAVNEIIAAVRNYLKVFRELSIKLIVNPAGFFRAMPKTGGLVDPLLYVVMTSLLGVVFSTVISFVTRGVGLHGLGQIAIWLAIVPLITLIMSFFIAAISFAIWSFTGSNENYETSYRCLAYMHILMPISIVLSIVPYMGLLVIVWWLYLIMIATREVHKVQIMNALLAFGVIAAMFGVVYYSSVSSTMNSKRHLEEFTKELKKVPSTGDLDSAIKR